MFVLFWLGVGLLLYVVRQCCFVGVLHGLFDAGFV